MTIPGYYLWVVIFFFYFVEHIKPVDQSTLLVFHSGKQRIDFTTDIFHFNLIGKTFAILPCLNFNRVTFMGKYLNPGASHLPSKRRELQFLDLVRLRTLCLSRMEPVAVAFYFVVCPALTIALGLTHSLRFILPIHLGFVIFSISQILKVRRMLARKPLSSLGLVFEVIVSPGVIPALGKKVSTLYFIKNDVPLLLLGNLTMKRRSDELYALKSRVEEMLDCEEVSQQVASTYLHAIENIK